MDPVGTAASVAGLLTIVAQTIKLCKEFSDASKRAGETASAFTTELEILFSNLTRLKSFLGNDSSAASNFGQTSMLMIRSQATERRLRYLNQRLKDAASSRLRQAMWPSNEKDHRESMQELRALSQWIQFSLAIDTSALLSQISEGIVAMLTKQLENIRQLDTIQSKAESIESSLTMQTDMLDQAREEEKRQKIFSWLSTCDQEQKHNEVREPRVKGTGEWLFETEAFRGWHSTDGAGAFLWCHGVQGSGKSVLTSLVIDKIRTEISAKDANAALAYFYFDHRNKDSISPVTVICNLARQLLSTKTNIPKSILEIYEKVGTGKPNLEAAKSIFLHACTENSATYIVLDALDECEEKTYRAAFLGFLDKLKSRVDFRMFVTSRNDPGEIQRTYELQIQAHATDLRRYISQTIDNDPAAGMIDPGFSARLIEKIVTTAHGTFLLPVLQVQMVLDAPTLGEMEEAMETLPSTIYDAFDTTVAQINSLPPARKHLGMKSLMWIFYTGGHRRLRMIDLREALAIRLGQNSTDPRFRPSTEMILSCCRGLVALEKGTLQPRFIHQAVQEYLQVHEAELFPDGESHLGEMCLTYLLTSPVRKSICETERDLLDRISFTPFLWYAACCWARHVQRPKKDTTMCQIIEFLGSKSPQSCIQISEYMRGRRELYWGVEETESNTALHIAAYFGLEEVIQMLLQRWDIEVDAVTSIGTTALMKACSHGHIEVIRLLIDKGADPRKENWYGSSLHVAAEADQSEAIQFLLEAGMDVDTKDNHGRTALDIAIDERNLRAVKLLINYGGTCKLFSLHPELASEDHCLQVMSIPWTGSDAGELRYDLWLLMMRKTGKDALVVSIEQNRLDFARVLLASGAAIERRGSRDSPLHVAAAKGNVEATRLLLEAGANVNAGCGDEHTPYWYAAALEHAEVQQVLLEFGATVCHPSVEEVRALADRKVRWFRPKKKSGSMPAQQLKESTSVEAKE